MILISSEADISKTPLTAGRHLHRSAQDEAHGSENTLYLLFLKQSLGPFLLTGREGKLGPFLILITTGQNINKVNPTEMDINSDLQRK